MGISTQGYIRYGWSGKYLEHREIISSVIGRKLKSNEIIHHINGIKTDNRPSNLMVTDRSEHAKMHMTKYKPDGDEKQCSGCKIVKNLSEFSKRSVISFGVRSECRDCSKIRRRSYYLKHGL